MSSVLSEWLRTEWVSEWPSCRCSCVRQPALEDSYRRGGDYSGTEITRNIYFQCQIWNCQFLDISVWKSFPFLLEKYFWDLITFLVQYVPNVPARHMAQFSVTVGLYGHNQLFHGLSSIYTILYWWLVDRDNVAWPRQMRVPSSDYAVPIKHKFDTPSYINVLVNTSIVICFISTISTHKLTHLVILTVS